MGTKEFKYPRLEYAQYFFTGEYLVRFEGYYLGRFLPERISNFPDTAQTVTLGTKTFMWSGFGLETAF